MIGGGIPLGRFIEIIGENSTAKTGLLLQIIAAFQRAGHDAVLLEPEAKLDPDWAQRLGVDWAALHYDQPEDLKWLTQFLARVGTTASAKKPVVIGVDSLAAVPGIGELEAAESEEGMGEEKMKRARHLSQMLRATLLQLSKKNVTLIAINQLRTKVDFRTGYSGFDSTGGKAIKYHTAVRLNMKNRGRLKTKVGDVTVGIQVEVEAIKNQMAPPFRATKMRFRFETGFDRWFGLDELLIRYGRVENIGGWLSFKGRKFRRSEIEQVAAEMPEILEPIRGVIERAEGAPEPELKESKK